MRMVRWMCGVKLKDRLPSKELRERLGVDDIALVLQQNEPERPGTPFRSFSAYSCKIKVSLK